MGDRSRDGRLTVARRELASLKSEKTIILAILIQLFVAAFSSFLVVGLVSLYDPGAVSNDVSISVGVSGNASDDLAAVVGERDSLRAVQFPSHERAMNEFRAGEVNAVLRAQRTPDGQTAVTAIAPESGFRSTFVVVQLKEVLTAYERSERRQLESSLVNEPVPLPSRARSSPYFGFTYTVLIPLLMFLPVFISGSIAVDSIAEEIERGTFELLRVTPLSLTDIVDGKIVAMALLVPLQAGTWLALLSANGTSISNPFEVLALVSAFAVAVVAMGVAIALRFGDRERSQFVYSLGILVIFSVTYLLPESPANTVAKLVIDSPTWTTHATVVASIIVGLVATAGVRRLVERTDTESLS